MKAPNPKPCTDRKQPMEIVVSFAITDHRILNHTMRSNNMVQGKHQFSNKFQSPKFEKNLFGHLKLEFGVYLGFGICDLGF